jgi:hypothetical protein
VRPIGRRKKKLIVAFHFQAGNQAGWRCDECRKAGLEMKRRCGWKAEALATPPRVVWARRHAATEICPKAYISAESVGWIESFLVRRRLGWERITEMNAREAEAHLILMEEYGNEHA